MRRKKQLREREERRNYVGILVSGILRLKWTMRTNRLMVFLRTLAPHEMSRTNIILWVKSSLEGRETNPGKSMKIKRERPTLAEGLGSRLILNRKSGIATGIFNISGSDFLIALLKWHK